MRRILRDSYYLSHVFVPIVQATDMQVWILWYTGKDAKRMGF